ncbi:Bug family tripartite tricarboxylate transporter substrate binding protein [Ideonella livida]|uniref:Tripartite tricarboxylate transporter substrate binding protein n=1 Tax=Ideonella livida TaxID=2707176 RepID=A0A7C9TJ39_9BURK|nr:tripartite tricarboxylate transporter substrate binding protein [Ideonella livida]NDY91819.1 tripartite tricarboxylate transporter substrate binding protein [Ideonella livida]
MTSCNLSRRQTLACATGLALGSLAAPAARAQAFPQRPLSWVVPYPSGGFGDALSRLLAQKMETALGQTVLVDNRPGAGGQIGAAFVKQQPADGHTLFYGDIGPFAMNGALYPKLNYDTLADFQPLSRLVLTPLLVVVPANSPWKDWNDLVQAARRGPPPSYGSYGVGSQPHVWTEMLERQLGAKLNHVPYKGAAPALQDLLGGRLDFMCDVAPSSLPLVRDGKLRALAVVGSHQRLSLLPQVPTVAELGLPALNLPGWNGVMVRRGTPEPVLARLHQALLAALQAPEVAQRYQPLGLTLAPQSPEAFGDFIRQEAQRWGQVIRQAAITLE